MNKKLIYGLCAASFLMTACDYNEDNFPGFDQEPLTDIVYYEGEFPGSILPKAISALCRVMKSQERQP